jgi:hypothetical protein
METRMRGSILSAVAALFLSCSTTPAQNTPPAGKPFALTLEPGTALHVSLAKRVPIKKAGIPL